MRPQDVLIKQNLPGGTSAVVPPDPMPNSEVKRRSADGSVGSPHVRVGNCQASNKAESSVERLSFFAFVSSGEGAGMRPPVALRLPGLQNRSPDKVRSTASGKIPPISPSINDYCLSNQLTINAAICWTSFKSSSGSEVAIDTSLATAMV